MDGRVAIVTGGGRGRGRAMAQALTEAGARVIAVDLRADKPAHVEREAQALANGDARIGIAGDLRNAEDCLRELDAAHGKFGGHRVFCIER